MARVKGCLRAGKAPALGQPLVSAGLRLECEVKLQGLLVERLRIRDILLVCCVDDVSVVAPAPSAPAHRRILVPLFLTPSHGRTQAAVERREEVEGAQGASQREQGQ